MSGGRALERRELALHRADDDGIGGEHVRGETSNDLATAIDEELLEVPGKLGGVVYGEPVAAELVLEAGVGDAGNRLSINKAFGKAATFQARWRRPSRTWER